MSLMRTVHVQRIASTARMPSSAHQQARGCVARNASVAQCGYAPDVRMRQSGCVYALGYNDALGDSAHGSLCATAHHMAAARPPATCVWRRVCQFQRTRIRQVQRMRTGAAWRPKRIRRGQRTRIPSMQRPTHRRSSAHAHTTISVHAHTTDAAHA